MAAKLIHSASAAKTDPADVAERCQHADQKAGRRSDPDKNSDDVSARTSVLDSAEYIAVLASQLQRIAETNGHEFLAYLIDMVVVEAWRIAGPDADHPDKKPMALAASKLSTPSVIK
jgi:uncharacterized iron-regulated protein